MPNESFQLDQWLKELGEAIRARSESIVREPLPEPIASLVRQLKLIDGSRDAQ
jgi:hypothetical protein